MIRILTLAMTLVLTLSAARAAELDGVVLPDTTVEGGTTLRLNGIGVRTVSFLRLRVYVAGLYLPRPSNDATAILRSPEPRLLVIHFLRDVDEAKVRDAWREGLTNACKWPCYLDPHDLDRFLEKVGAVHAGDETRMLFTANGAVVKVNGSMRGEVSDLHFTEIMLASFIGDAPPTPELKRQLLGNRE
jgi:hypothetical protein